jgi:soluble lytic murein transglycosylase-like protein
LLLIALLMLQVRARPSQGFSWKAVGKLPLKQRIEALASALPLVRIEPDRSLVCLALGSALDDDGKPKEALPYLLRASSRSCPLWEYAVRFRLDQLSGDPPTQQAVDLWKSLFWAGPAASFRGEAAAVLSQFYLNSSTPAKALPYFRWILKQNRYDVLAASRLASLYLKSGRREAAHALAVWLWTEMPADENSKSFFENHPALENEMNSLPPIEYLRRLARLDAEGDWRTLERELPRFHPRSTVQTAWKRFLQARLDERRGRDFQAYKTYLNVRGDPYAKAASLRRAALLLPGLQDPEKLIATLVPRIESLPSHHSGRASCLLAVARYYSGAQNAALTAKYAFEALALSPASLTACEFLYEAAWEMQLSGDAAGFVRTLQNLAAVLPEDNDYRSAALFSLLLRGKLHGEKADSARREILTEGKYGYFGYRIRKGPPARSSSSPVLFKPSAPKSGGHRYKAELLQVMGFYREAAEEFRMAGKRSPSRSLSWQRAVAFSLADRPVQAVVAARSAYPRAWTRAGDRVPKRAWEIIYPLRFPDILQKEASRCGLPPLLLAAVIRRESLWNETAVSGAGASGLMQLMPGTAASVATRHGLPPLTRDRLFDPSWNTRAGATYFKGLLERYDDKVYLALAAYNAGTTNVDQWLARPGCPADPEGFIESIPYRETRSYVRQIYLNDWEYHRIYPGIHSSMLPYGDAPARIHFHN